MTATADLPTGAPERVHLLPQAVLYEMGAGEFAHSADTLDGRFQHRQMDRPEGGLPASLALAKGMVTAKLRNSRVMLRRNHPQAPTVVREEMYPWLRGHGSIEARSRYSCRCPTSASYPWLKGHGSIEARRPF